jgi:hypothetical protein
VRLGTFLRQIPRLSQVWPHELPVNYLVENGNSVAVEVHREGGDDVSLGAEADGGRQRLAGQHVRTVELAVDDAVEQYLPIGLGLRVTYRPSSSKLNSCPYPVTRKNQKKTASRPNRIRD